MFPRTSSRSHAVLQVTVRQQSRGSDLAEEVRVGRLFMVDLAGSEQASQTQNRGKRMQEGAHINRSLLALGNCINALSEKGSRAQYVNFRDSKLTRLLKDALGGNSRTVMIAHISPASTSFEESRTTLLYADRAKSIKTRVKRNLLTVSYHITQYTDVISGLRREIERLKSKLERREQQKESEPGVRDTQVTVSTQDTEEDSRLQMNKIRAQLVGAFKEQLEMRRSLVELENASTELHVDASRHLLAIADWEREKTHHHTQNRTPGRGEEQVVAGADGGTGKSAESHEVALAREEVNMLLAEQQKTMALKAGLEQRLAGARRKASQLEDLLPRQAISEDQREVLRLLCRTHELELEKTELQASSLRQEHLLGQKDLVIQRYQQHRLLCEHIIQAQRQLIQDGGIRVPAPLDEPYGLYSRELGEGSLNRLLLLHSVMASSLQDDSVMNTSPLPEESSQEQPDDRNDLPWGAQFKLSPVLLETDSDGYKSSKAMPSKKLGKQDFLLPLPSLRIRLTPPTQEKSSSLSMKNLVSKLCSPAGWECGTPRMAAEDLKEMAASTKTIALLAATRRSKAQDRDGSHHSSPHLPEEVAPDARDPSPADRKWPHTSPGRDGSVDRKAWSTQSASLSRSVQPAALQHLAESQAPPAPHRLPKSPSRRLFPAVPVASNMKPSLSFHADENSLHVPEVGFTLPRATWQSSTGPSRAPLLPPDIRGSTDSRGRRHSPLPPSNLRKHQGGSAKKPRRPK
ncbi:PREDICTED: kinesin-like protein KIF19 [Hipposideros armiger]|uniref:Kinesin-like protein n=1 Tax=Hipposideros armiger TaxID=186990 RepID=A0A8B7QZ02_HIPAR|nr:PREDICTED: kinesin-like protein KIF19 [Hipposideros armiger]